MKAKAKQLISFEEILSIKSNYFIISKFVLFIPRIIAKNHHYKKSTILCQQHSSIFYHPLL